MSAEITLDAHIPFACEKWMIFLSQSTDPKPGTDCKANGPLCISTPSKLNVNSPVHSSKSWVYSYLCLFDPAEQTSTTIVGTVPDGATKFTFTEGTDKAVTYIKTGSDGMLK